MSADQPLELKVKDGLLSVSIGVNILAFAIENAGKPESQGLKITNPEQFAEDVISAMKEEDYGGESMILKLIDGAAARAVEYSEGVLINE